MKAVRRFLAPFRDSPTYGRDRANLISGFSIGTAGLLLNGAMLMLVLPLMLDPDEPDFRAITENVEFGQLLALILLGGATAFATFLIPLRLVTVFWGPRVGRYFDQVVLSGISPLRYVIGKALSQNLFLGLILFLLLPYLVLSLMLGGVEPGAFLAGLFLVWLYCMALAVATLWASLYLNELLAAGLVIAVATFFAVLGSLPIPIQPFVLTPLPALVHPVYSSIPDWEGDIPADFLPIYFSCAASLTAVIGVSLCAVFLGPLYGIIRENSTFGEVVRAGDSKQKRWFRLRLHIQRPSEISFFYENRSDVLRRHEGAVRWGSAFLGLLLLSAAASLVFLLIFVRVVGNAFPGQGWWVYEFHMVSLTIHGCGLVLAIFLFSHARNSTYLKVPFLRGRRVEVSRLDSRAFLLFTLVSTAASIATPFAFDRYVALPSGQTVFPELMYVTRGRPVDYVRLAVEGTAVITVAGLAVYALHRLACLMTWLRSLALVGTAGAYAFAVCILPLFIGMMFLEVPALREVSVLRDWRPTLAMASPVTVIMFLFNEMGSRFPRDASTVPFYLMHTVLLGVTIIGIRRRGTLVREQYLDTPASEVN